MQEFLCIEKRDFQSFLPRQKKDSASIPLQEQMLTRKTNQKRIFLPWERKRRLKSDGKKKKHKQYFFAVRGRFFFLLHINSSRVLHNINITTYSVVSPRTILPYRKCTDRSRCYRHINYYVLLLHYKYHDDGRKEKKNALQKRNYN